jgi:hypothetical protein
MFNKSLLTLAFAGITTFSAYATAADTLTMEVYNPGEKSVFPVSSEIISGKHEVALIDAQFQRNDAEELVKKIKATGKKLTTVYISHSDPRSHRRKSSLHRAPSKKSTPPKTAKWPTGAQF